MSLPFIELEREMVSRLPSGAVATDIAPGDFVLTHDDVWTSRIIRFGQLLRFRGADKPYAHWNHVAVVTGADGTLVEALPSGVARTHISKYQHTERHVVRIRATDNDRHQVARFAEVCVGQKPGFLTLFSIALSLLTGASLDFGLEGQQTCSGLVGRALERTDAIFSRTPSHLMPADLAKQYGVRPNNNEEG